MAEKWTNILGFLTLLAVLALTWVFFGEDPSAPTVGRGEAFFPSLASEINGAEKITIEDADRQLTLTNKDGQWHIGEKDGYKADPARIGTLLRGLVNSKRRDPKTADKSKFAKLGLGDKQVTLRIMGMGKKILVDVQLGKRAAIGSDRSLSYAYKPSDARAWLVTSLPEVSPNFLSWVDSRISPIAAQRIRSLALAEGKVMSRASPTAPWVMEGSDQTPRELSTQVTDFSNLSFSDVKALSNPLKGPAATIEMQTFDGLSVIMAEYAMDDGHWVQLQARYDENDIFQEGNAVVLPGAPADGAAEAARLNTRWSGWFFKLATVGSAAGS